MRLALPALALLLAGCGAPTLQTLEATGQSVVIASPLQWEEAYRIINSQAQRCIAVQSPLSASPQVDGQLYPEQRMGEVTVALPGFTRNRYYGRVTVRPSATGSEITVTGMEGKLGATFAPRVRKWLDGSTDCR